MLKGQWNISSAFSQQTRNMSYALWRYAILRFWLMCLKMSAALIKGGTWCRNWKWWEKYQPTLTWSNCWAASQKRVSQRMIATAKTINIRMSHHLAENSSIGLWTGFIPAAKNEKKKEKKNKRRFKTSLPLFCDCCSRNCYSHQLDFSNIRLDYVNFLKTKYQLNPEWQPGFLE